MNKLRKVYNIVLISLWGLLAIAGYTLVASRVSDLLFSFIFGQRELSPGESGVAVLLFHAASGLMAIIVAYEVALVLVTYVGYRIALSGNQMMGNVVFETDHPNLNDYMYVIEKNSFLPMWLHVVLAKLMRVRQIS